MTDVVGWKKRSSTLQKHVLVALLEAGGVPLLFLASLSRLGCIAAACYMTFCSRIFISVSAGAKRCMQCIAYLCN